MRLPQDFRDKVSCTLLVLTVATVVVACSCLYPPVGQVVSVVGMTGLAVLVLLGVWMPD